MTKQLHVFFSIIIPFAFCCVCTPLSAQTVIYAQNFGNYSSVSALPVSNLPGWTSDNPADLNINSDHPSTGYSTSISASGGPALYHASANGIRVGTAIATLSGMVNTTNYTNIQVLYAAHARDSYSGTTILEWSSDGITWNNIPYTTNTNAWSVINNGNWLTLPSGAAGQANLRFRFTFNITTPLGSYRIDDFTVRGTCTPLSISLATTNGNCLISNSLALSGASSAAQIQWKQNGTTVSTIGQTYSATGTTVAGGNGGGSATNQLYNPTSLWFDGSGNMYVADYQNHRIQKWAVGAISGVTVAGGNGAGSAANQFNFPVGVFVDGSGNIYVADVNNHRIQKWAVGATSGVTVAGGNGAGSAANQLNAPNSVKVDIAGNIYIADYYNHRIQKWATGASTGTTAAGGNGAGSAANQLNGPIDVFVDVDGNIYVTDHNNRRIQKWAAGASTGVTVAGGNGAGSAANQLTLPQSVVVDGNGNIYISDYGNHRIQKWAAGATTGTTIAGGNGAGSAANQLNGPNFLYLEDNGNLYVADYNNNRIQKFLPSINTTYTPSVSGTYTAVVSNLSGCSATSNSIIINPTVTPSVSIAQTSGSNPNCAGTALTFTATPTNGGTSPNFQWKKNGTNIGTNSATYTDDGTTSGVISCVMTVGTDICPTTPTATSSTINLINNTPLSISLATTNGNCLISNSLTLSGANTASQIVWKQNGTTVSTVNQTYASSGTTVAGGNGNGSAANQLSYPRGVYVDANGNIYVTEAGNNRIQKWAAGATSGVTVVGGNGLGTAANQFNEPYGIFTDAAGTIYVADVLNNRIQKWAVGATSGVTVAGGNGAGSAANQLFAPLGVFVDANGTIYIADRNNHRVQKWVAGATSGTTVAGGNGQGSAANQLNNPHGVFVDANNNLYVAETVNHRITKWAAGASTGTTVAGGNGQGSAANQLSLPITVSVNVNGNLFIVDYFNHRIQRWANGATTGTTIAGGNGAGNAANQFNEPTHFYFDATGNLYVSEYNGHRVSKWAANSISTTYTPSVSGTYTAVVSNQNGCSATTNSVVINPTSTPSVSIAQTSGTNPNCAGTAVNFTATPTNGGTNPSFQWKKGGNNVGINSATYTDDGTTSGVISCVMTVGTDICPTTPTATSSTINLINNTPLSISLATTNGNCLSGNSLALTGASSANQIQWRLNGSTVSTTGQTYSATGTTVAGGNGAGSAANQVNRTTNLYIDGSGNMYVVDYTNGRIQKWAVGANTGVTVAGGNGTGSAANQLSAPADVYVDANGNVYIADDSNNRVQKWGVGATTGVTVAGGNGSGSAANQLIQPSAVYVDGNGNIYVADKNNHRVQKWAVGSNTGVTVAGGNGQGSASNQLNNPQGLYVDGTGNMYIADRSNHRIQKWAVGATTGVTVAGGNGSGSAANQLADPHDVLVDVLGNVFVADYGNLRIQRWFMGASSGTTVAGGNGGGSALNQIYPHGISLETTGNLYVADYHNSRVQKWATTGISTNYTLSVSGSYTAVVSNLNGCSVTTNEVVINPSLTPSVSINLYQGSNPTCQGSNIVVVAYPSNGGTNPTYTWSVGSTTTVTNIDSYAFTAQSTGNIQCMMTVGTGICVTSTVAVSPYNPSTFLTVNPTPSPVIATTNGNCLADNSLTATGVNAVSQFQWKLNGTTVSTVTPNTVGAVTIPAYSGIYGSNYNFNYWNKANGVSVDNSGNVFVVDQGNQRVMQYSNTYNQVVGISVLNRPWLRTPFYSFYASDAPDGLHFPSDIFTDATGAHYIADSYNHRIQKWTSGATEGITVAGGNGSGSGVGQLSFPSDVFLDATGNIYVADRDNHRIQKWAVGATSGVTVAGGNGQGAAANQLSNPASVFVDATGNVFVSDSSNNRVQKWAVGATSGVTVAGGNGRGAATNQLNQPCGIAVDAAGNVYVSDQKNDRIQKWDVGATLGSTVSFTTITLRNPAHLFMDKDENLYITDQVNDRIVKLVTKSNINFTPTTAGTYTAVATTSAGCVGTSNSLIINQNTTPSVSISTATTAICTGASVTFTPTPTNGGTSPTYTWKKNGSQVATGNSYMANNLANNDVITCEMVSNATCADLNPVISNSLTMTTKPIVTPSVSIAITNGTNDVCVGTAVTFTATPQNAGASPSYHWRKDGTTVGSNSVTYIDAGTVAGSVTCQITAGSDVCVQ